MFFFKSDTEIRNIIIGVLTKWYHIFNLKKTEIKMGRPRCDLTTPIYRDNIIIRKKESLSRPMYCTSVWRVCFIDALRRNKTIVLPGRPTPGFSSCTSKKAHQLRILLQTNDRHQDDELKPPEKVAKIHLCVGRTLWHAGDVQRNTIEPVVHQQRHVRGPSRSKGTFNTTTTTTTRFEPATQSTGVLFRLDIRDSLSLSVRAIQL